MDDIDLRNLTSFDFGAEKMDAHFARMRAIQQSYRDKYGDAWKTFYRADRARENDIKRRKTVNEFIYAYGRARMSRIERVDPDEQTMFDARLREVYGDQYDELITNRVDFDPRVAELLVDDAVRSGEWEALPDELVARYMARFGDVL